MSKQSAAGLGINSNIAPRRAFWEILKRSWLFCFVVSVFIGVPLADHLSITYTALPAQQALLLAFEAKNEKGRFEKTKSTEKAALSFRQVREQTVERLNNLAQAVDNSQPGNLLSRVFSNSARREEVSHELRKIANRLNELEEGQLEVSTFQVVAADVKRIFRLAKGATSNGCHFTKEFEEQLRRSLSISSSRFKDSVNDFELSLDKQYSADELLVVAAQSCEDSRDVFLGLGFIMFSDTYRDYPLPAAVVEEILLRQNFLVRCMERLQTLLEATEGKDSKAAVKIAGYLSSNRTRATVMEQLKIGDYEGAVHTVAAAN